MMEKHGPRTKDQDRVLAWMMHYWQSGLGRPEVQAEVSGKVIRMTHAEARAFVGFAPRPPTARKK